MSAQQTDMVELKDRDRAVLRVLSDGRANPMLIREETSLDKGKVNTVLVKLTRDGLVRRRVQGLYEITDRGRGRLNDE